MKLLKKVATFVTLLILIGHVATAATWDGGGGADKAWTNTANWANNPATWPGQSGDTETVATLSGGLALVDVNLRGGVLSTLNVINSATLRIQPGALLPSANLSIDPVGATGNGATFEMNGGNWTNNGSIGIGRWSNGPSNSTSTFRMNGGFYTNNNSASSGRVDQGHSDNRGLSLAQFYGGEFWLAGPWNMAGNTDGRSRIEFTGGRFRAATLNAGSGDTSDGFQAEIRIQGTGAASINPVNLNLHRHASNAIGRSWINFIADAAGVTPVTTTNLNLGTTAGRQGELQVDLSNYHPGIAGNNTLVLCTYTKLTGTFGAVNVILGENTLSYELNYAYQGNKIALVNIRHVPLQVESRVPTAGTDTTANLVSAINYVDAGGAEIWIYYGPVDGRDVAGNWQSSVRVGSGLTTGQHTVQVTNLTPDSRYYYRVYATHGATGVWADFSQMFGTSFAAGQSPVNLTAQGSWDKVQLSWGEAFNSESGFVIQRATDANFTQNVTTLQVAGVDKVSATDLQPVTGIPSYYRVAAVNSSGLSAWSNVVSTTATASIKVVTQATLSASSIFNLQQETQKMALRGTRAASISAWIAGVQVPLAETNAFQPGNYGATTNSTWYIDPMGSSGTTQFRTSYPWLFDFGNGVVSNLELVPVHVQTGSSWDSRILLNLGYTGEISIDGTDYIVDVVQGASPEIKDRLSYPGYFNDPGVNVLLYQKPAMNRVPSIGRMKFINGVWYSFDSNASGEQLTVSRMDGMGTLVLDAGRFQSADLAFISGEITHERGWTLSLPDLTFSNATTTLPSGKYHFSECKIRNAGKTYSYIYHSSIKDAAGSLDIPPDGTDVLTVGQNHEIRVWLKNYKAPNRLLDYLWMDTQLIDTDMGAAVVPEQSEWMKVIGCWNSRGDAVACKWDAPYGCGWNGAYLFSEETRIGDSRSSFAMPTDYNPPAVYDTRRLRVGSTMTGLYGPAYADVPFNVVNERKAFQARYYNFDAPLTAFPDFDNILPALEKLETNPPPSSAVTTPWTGLPPEMADTFGVRYDFDFFQQKGGYIAPANYSVYVKCQGAARVYWDNQLIAENVSHGSVTEVSAPLPAPVPLDSYHKVRIEYLHNEGPSMLEVRLSGTILISATYPLPTTNYLRPGELWNIAPVQVPAALSVNSPTGKNFAAPASLTVSAGAQHPDGISNMEVFVNGIKKAVGTNAQSTFLLDQIPVNAKVSVRAVDPVGYGTFTDLDVNIHRQSLADWLADHGLPSGSGDDDFDGKTNAEEYAADTNPRDARSGLKVATTSFVPDSSAMRIQWNGVTTASPAIGHYQIQYSSDLIQWLPMGDPVPLNSSGQYNVDCKMAGAAKCFFRILSVPR